MIKPDIHPPPTHSTAYITERPSSHRSVGAGQSFQAGDDISAGCMGQQIMSRRLVPEGAQQLGQQVAEECCMSAPHDVIRCVHLRAHQLTLPHSHMPHLSSRTPNHTQEYERVKSVGDEEMSGLDADACIGSFLATNK